MRWKNIALWILALVCIFIAVDQMNGKSRESPVSYSKFLDQVEEGVIKSVIIQGFQIRGYKEKFENAEEQGLDPEYPELFPGRDSSKGAGLAKDRVVFTTIGPIHYEESLLPFLRGKKVEIRLKPPEQISWWRALFINWFPFILLFGTWIYILNKMQGGGNKAMSFGKSRARELSEGQNKITFKDVAGIEEAKESLQEIVEFLRFPEKFTKIGAKIPCGVLLMGPPGTGKTLLAKAIAGEAGVPFLSISGSEFVEMFVGVGASRVRDLFEQARKRSPCIIFMDEIDAVGRQRGAGLGGGHDEREQTLNQILVEMDGFDSSTGVIMIAATNRPDVLDPALLRPGRFDRKVVVDIPDVRGRHSIMKVHTRGKPLADDVNLAVLARRTPGLSGADIYNVANEAAILAARKNSQLIYMKDFEEAIDRVLLGPERRSMILSQKERTNTAYHELGHAIIGTIRGAGMNVHKVTIIPRGRALGVTYQLPEDDKVSTTREEFMNQIMGLLGGRIAEEIALKVMTTGAANDLEKVAKIARAMVCNFGMSETVGPISYTEGSSPVFLGRDIIERRTYSENMAEVIDREIKKIVDQCYIDARRILEENLSNLHRISVVLLERETLSGEELKKLLEGEQLPPIVLEGKGDGTAPTSEPLPESPLPPEKSPLAPIESAPLPA